ncbi:MAG: phosphoglucomutase/phosphomannomutase family protein [Candidatus Omnitrophica bacterium]|nr:phosphoglucomutase/phosphomannomutase family protein [Candidatus Omnitrophota bacterium]
MSNLAKIRFGTSGWRAIIAEDFTFENVRLVSQAMADYLKDHKQSKKVLIGYDTRFLSGHFARVCAEVFASNQIQVLLADRDTPTPAIAFNIIDQKLGGGINFTASHNPPEYNGIKFSPAYGGPAQREVTQAIEQRITELQKNNRTIKLCSADCAQYIKSFDPKQAYLKRLKQIIDFSCIKKAKLKIAVDCMYGTSRGYIDQLLKPNVKELVMFHDYLNPLFGGLPPEPDKPYIQDMITHVKKNRFDLGLGCDGDADRFGIVDKGGEFLYPNEIITLLFHYLLKTRPKAAKVARTLSSTHMIDAIAAAHGIEVIETPVGFKYIGEALNRGDCIIGGEESGGLSIQGHVPEKDGILACLLVAEMVAREKKSLSQMMSELREKYGNFYSGRKNMRLEEKQKEVLLDKLKKLSQQQTFGELQVRSRNFTDGYKLLFDNNCWVMFRPSGTEPVMRCYFEANSKKKLDYIKQLIDKFVKV